MLKGYIDVNLKESILDPQGTAVKEGLLKLGFHVDDVRIGKHIEVLLKDTDMERAKDKIEEMCEKFLINPEIETYRYTFKED